MKLSKGETPYLGDTVQGAFCGTCVIMGKNNDGSLFLVNDLTKETFETDRPEELDLIESAHKGAS